MPRNSEKWLSVVDAFQSAALGCNSWDSALKDFADATGSRSSQLIGRMIDFTVLFNIMTNVDPAAKKLAIDQQSINPRPLGVKRAPLLESIADWDILTLEESQRSAFYQEVLRPWDIPFFCATVIERQEDTFVTLGVLRSQAEGYITGEQRRIFSMLAPHVRAAIRLHAALEGNGAAVLAGTMEALSIPSFICDRTGRVRLLTPTAEALVAGRNGLELKDGRLRAVRANETRALHDAIDAAVPRGPEAGPPAPRSVVIHGREPGAAPIVLDVFALPPRPRSLGPSSTMAQVLIVACGQRRADVRRAAILGAVYGLTAAETDVAQRLATGQSAHAIAAHRGVAIGTIRTQIKTILGKLGLRRQAEIAARLNQL